MFNELNSNLNHDTPWHMELHEDVEESKESPILNKTVRSKYFQYLKMLLTDNAIYTETEISDKEITLLAQEIEHNAMRLSISSLVYRYIMIKEIHNINVLTSNNKSLLEKKIIESAQVLDSSDGINAYLQHFTVTSSFIKESDENDLDKMFQEIGDDKSFVNKNISVKSEPMNTEDKTSNDIKEELMDIDMQSLEPSQINTQDEKIKLETPIPGSEECSTVEEKNEDNVFKNVNKEMCDMFDVDENINSIVQGPSVDEHRNQTSFSSTDKYFYNENKKSLLNYYEIHKARYRQKISPLAENNNKDKLGIKMVNYINTYEDKKKIQYICKDRITWHVKRYLSVFYKTHFTSTEHFRTLAKNIVFRFLQIDPFLDYKCIQKSINRSFLQKEFEVTNSGINKLVMKISSHVKYLITL